MNFVKGIFRFLFRHIELPILTSFLLFKMFYFAKEVGIHFLSQKMLMLSVGSIILLYCISLLFKRINRLVAIGVISLIGSFVVYADLIYFRYFGDFITTPVLSQSNQVGGITSSITELMNPIDILYFLDVILLLIIAVVLKFKKAEQRIAWKERFALFVVAAAVGTYLVATPIQDYIDKYGTNIFINTWSNVSVYNVTGHLGFHLFETQKYIREQVINKPVLAEGRDDELERFLEEHQSPHLIDTEFFGAAEGMNVMMIQLESYQNYVIQNEVNGQEITPHLNALIDESYYFSNFYHQVAQGRTSDAEFLTNNSLYPLPTGSVYVRNPTNSFDSIPGILNNHNYYTGVYHSYDKNFWNRSLVYDNYGFDTFMGQGDFEEGQKAGPFDSLGDEELFLQMIEDNKDQQPFYKFAVALTSHHPYTMLPSEHRTLDVGSFEGTIFGNYLHSTHYVDYAVGQMIDKLKTEGLWDNTVLILYGDHDSGLEFTEEQAAALGVESDEISRMAMKDQVPLVIRVPGTDEGETFTHSTGMIDVAPTILHLLGIEDDTNHLGTPVFTMEDQLVPFRYGSFKKGDMYYQASLDGVFENGSCYDISGQKELDLEQCREGAAQTREQLRFSDDIITHDFLADEE